MSASDPVARGCWVSGERRSGDVAPFFGGLGEKLHRQPNADLSPRTDVVMGQVPGRRGGPPLPLGDREGLQGGGFELQLERSGVACLLQRPASCYQARGDRWACLFICRAHLVQRQ